MGTITDTANVAIRDFETNGVPSSGDHEVLKSDERQLFALVDIAISSAINGVAIGSSVIYATLASLNSDLAHNAGALGVVYNDSTAANNGVYFKVGGSGSGSWSLSGLSLPSTFATDIAATTAEAITAQVAAAGSATAALASQTAAATSATTAASLAATAAAAVVATLTSLSTAAAASAAGALTSQTNASTSANAAAASAATAVAAATGAGITKFYTTKALAVADVGSITNLQVVEVLTDESLSGHRTLYQKQSGVLVFVFDLTPKREYVSVDRTYYVRSGGSDSGTGLTNVDGDAFLTINHAIRNVSQNLDVNCTITIQVQDGTWTENVRLLPWFGSGPTSQRGVIIQGNASNWRAVIFSPVSGDTVQGIDCNSWTIKNIKLVSAGSALRSDYYCKIFADGVVFGDANFHLSVTNVCAFIEGINNGYFVEGNANAHVEAVNCGEVTWNGTTNTFGIPRTATMTIASPGVLTVSGGAPVINTPCVLSTTGALPIGLTAGVTYYVVGPSGSTFELAATVGGAAINTSGTQSGVHTATVGPAFTTATLLAANCGVIDASQTTFVGKATGCKFDMSYGGIVRTSNDADLDSTVPGDVTGRINLFPSGGGASRTSLLQNLQSQLDIAGAAFHSGGTYTILPSDLPFLLNTAGLGAPVTWLLPLANSVAQGAELIVMDAGGIGGSNTITLHRQGSDTFIGPSVSSNTFVLATQYASCQMRSDGASAWYRIA